MTAQFLGDTQLTGVPQQIIIDPNTGLPQNVIIIQQPPPGPKIIGILIIIFGAITILGEVASLGESISYGGLFLVFSAKRHCWRRIYRRWLRFKLIKSEGSTYRYLCL